MNCQKKIVGEKIKGSEKNKLVILAPKFAVDLIHLIEQNRRNSELFRGLLRLTRLKEKVKWIEFR